MIIQDVVPPRKLNFPKKLNDLNVFFKYHLDHLYCAKAHLTERLGEIEGMEDEPVLNEAITATIRCNDSQLSVVERLYELIGRTYSFERCEQMIDFLDEYFNAVQTETDNKSLHALYFAAYLSFVRGVEETSLKLLQLCAAERGDEEMIRLLKIGAAAIAGDSALLTTIKSGSYI